MNNFQEIMNSWGWRIKRVQLTQEAFAEIAEVGINTVGNCVKGTANPTLRTIEKIEQTLRELEKEAGI